MKQIKWKNLLIIFFILICLIGLIISVINIIKWNIDSKNIDKQIADIQDIVEIVEIDDTENTEIVEPTMEVPKADPYWDYIKVKLIDVNFDELKKINKQTKGWIQINGTNINYPFVQTKDNKYYLNHAFDKSYNGAGWIFMDYRNVSNNYKNTILYGHGRYDNTMFGSLKNILTSGWLNNSDNYIVKLSTEEENTLWQVFSIYQIPVTSDYLQVDFSNDEEFEIFLKKLTDRSSYNFNTLVTSKDRIITLSTCYKNNDRVVLHAKLIKSEKK